MNEGKLIKKVGTTGLLKIALVAAIYVVATLALGEFSFGPIQARVSELLNFLAFIDPLYIVALTLGCAISNFFSFGLIDVVVGSFATLLSTYLMYKTKNMLVASLWPVINGAFVAAELYFLYSSPFWINFATVALGEFFIMTIIGVPLFKVIFKNKKFVESIRIDRADNTYMEKLQWEK